MILFTTPDCAACQRIKEKLHFDEVVDISTDDGFEHARRLGVRAVPTVIAFGLKFVGEQAIYKQFVEKL